MNGNRAVWWVSNASPDPPQLPGGDAADRRDRRFSVLPDNWVNLTVKALLKSLPSPLDLGQRLRTVRLPLVGFRILVPTSKIDRDRFDQHKLPARTSDLSGGSR